MLRLGINATSVLAGRGATATRNVLPLSSLAPLPALISRSGRGCNPCLSWRSSVDRQSYSGGIRGHAVSGSPAPTSCTAGAADAPAACDPSSYQSLSLLILLHECSLRAYGRPLTECTDLLALPTRLDSLPCCVMLLAPAPPSVLSQLPATRAGASSSDYQPDARNRTQGSRAQAGAASQTESGTCSEASSSGRGDGASLRVRYMNRAAAEALKLTLQDQSAGGVGGASSGASSGGSGGVSGGSSGSGAQHAGAAHALPRAVSWQVLEDGEGSGAELLHEVMASQGQPRRGEAAALTLRTAGPDGVGGGGAPITCPQALVLPLMSPNGACAGVALLFDRWEVRGHDADSKAAASAHGGGSAPRVLLQGRPLVPEIPPGSVPSEEELRGLQEAVRGQADAVRALKTQQGLANQDPRVIGAVSELQRLKADLELRQRLRAAFSEEAGPLQRLLQASPSEPSSSE